tara:strand:+ start:283 stop:690 length:408 start_codon:yes stop_codon:yes gene_type:complete
LLLGWGKVETTAATLSLERRIMSFVLGQTRKHIGRVGLGKLAFTATRVVNKGLARRSLSTAAGPQYSDGAHRSNAETLVNKVPVIKVNATVAVCDGGSGALGHPVEYIQLDTVSNEPQVCKYCGLRFMMGEVHHH